MSADAVSYGRGDDRRRAMYQSALAATLQTGAAAAGLCWERWIWERASDGGLDAIATMDQAAATAWAAAGG